MHIRKRYFLQPEISAVALVFGAALSATPIALAQTAPGKYTVSGSVVNAATSEPVVGALISVHPVDGSSTRSAGAMSGTGGAFLISGVAAGRYSIVSEKPGFMPGKYDQGPGQQTAITGDLTVTLRMQPWSVITGRITNPEHEPLLGAVVQLLQRSVVDGRLSTAVVAQAPTNDLGEYRLYGVPPGRYYVGAVFRDGSSALGLRHNTNLGQAGSDVATMEYTATWYPGVADPRDAIALKAKPGQTTEGIDIQLAVAAAVTIRGAIGNLAPGSVGHLMLEPADPQELGTRQSLTLSGNDKTFLFRSIPPGEYSITAQSGSGIDVLVAHRALLVADSPIRDIGLWLQPAPSVRGKVIVEGGGAVPEGLHIAFTGIDSRVRMDIPITRDGHISIGNLPPGKYRVTATAAAVARLKSLSLAGQQLPSNTLDVESSVESLEALVTTAAGRIEGVVKDNSGNAATSGLAVALTGASADKRISIAPIGDNGKYVFRALMPGEYRLIGFTDIDSAADLSTEAISRIDIDGQKIAVSDGDDKTLVLSAVRADSN